MAVAACAMTGCSLAEDDVTDCLPSDSAATSEVSISLLLSTPSAGRDSKAASNPTGGETGDGSEAGQTYEDEVEDLTVFFFPSSGATDDTEVTASAYFSNTQLTSTTDGYRTNAVQVAGLTPGVAYGLLVIANTGDVRTAMGTTLGSIRNYQFARYPWTQAAGTSSTTYSRFLMSSAEGDETLTVSTDGNMGTPDNPCLPNEAVSLERLAARVDYRTSDATYTLNNTNTGTTYNGTVTIQKAALVNRPNGTQSPTYLTKRVATTVGGDVTYFGDETLDDNGVATNYVIEPLTATKTAVTTTGYDSTVWAARYDNYFRTYGDDIAQNWQNLMTAGTVITDESNTDWTRVDYAVENTVGQANQDSRFVTGIVFSAKFVPTGLSGYTEGNTFFEFNGRLYASLSAMMGSYEGSTTNWQRSATDFQSMTWEQVREFANALSTNDPTGYRLYLLAQAADHLGTYSETVSADDAANLTWAAYMSATHGYNETVSTDGTTVTPVITSDPAATTNTRLSLSAYGIRTFENGVCYYTYWIKHANDGDDNTKGIMEHAIVRNNIYKIQVTGVRDLGDDIPSEEDNKLSIVVAVKDWTVLSKENFEF